MAQPPGQMGGPSGQAPQVPQTQATKRFNLQVGDTIQFTCCMNSLEGIHFCATDLATAKQYFWNSDTWELITLKGPVATFSAIDLEQNTIIFAPAQPQPSAPAQVFPLNPGERWEVMQHLASRAGGINPGAYVELVRLTGAILSNSPEWEIIVIDPGKPNWHDRTIEKYILAKCRPFSRATRPQGLQSGVSLQAQAQAGAPPHTAFVVPKPKLEPKPVSGPRCECGAQACGHPGHSSWCPMAVKP